MAVLPMFPLGTVLLPSAAIPLHVFEPRYRALVHDCLASDREFGIVLIARGSEVGGEDQRTDAGTVARIVEAVELPDGRWAIGAVGVRRVLVRGWLPDDPYPLAELDDWPDAAPSPAHGVALERTVTLLRRALALAAEAGDHGAPATVELSEDPVLAGYQASAVAPIGPHDRQRLLVASSPDVRLAALAEMLEGSIEVLRLRLAEG
ncbi:MAG: LON peptidase substrate-binding domain-containing protein [Acidimicrobiales bacterium]